MLFALTSEFIIAHKVFVKIKTTNYLADVASTKIDLITQMEVICTQETLLLNDLSVQKKLKNAFERIIITVSM